MPAMQLSFNDEFVQENMPNWLIKKITCAPIIMENIEMITYRLIFTLRMGKKMNRFDEVNKRN